MKPIIAAFCLAALGACNQLPANVQRGFDQSWQDTAFAAGPVSVVATENGERRGYSLTPCRNDTHICGTRAGHLTRTADYVVVTGAYAGREFLLSPGGDGWLKVGGQTVPLAWN